MGGIASVPEYPFQNYAIPFFGAILFVGRLLGRLKLNVPVSQRRRESGAETLKCGKAGFVKKP